MHLARSLECFLEKRGLLDRGRQRFLSKRAVDSLTTFASYVRYFLVRVTNELYHCHSFDMVLRSSQIRRKIQKMYGVGKNFTTNNSDLPRFYHLIKTHKKDKELKCRPIVSNANGPSKKISWLLCRILQPVLRFIPSHIFNSSQLLNELKAITPQRLEEFHYPISLDVCALYTSIPPQDAIHALERKLDEIKELKLPLQNEEACQLLSVVLENSFFEFHGRIYHQIKGLPMGNAVSGILSSIYMDALEKQVLHFPTIAIQRRYVDDLFILTTGEEEAKVIFERFNALDPNISFEMELPSQGELSLLDFTVKFTRDAENCLCLSFSFFKKSARKDIFVNARSAIPTSTKVNCIQNEAKRIREICSNAEEEQRGIETFKNILRRNNYPNKMVQKVVRNNKTKTRKKKQIENPVYLKFPFITDAITNKIQRIFASADLPVRIYDRNFTLRNALSKEDRSGKCTIRNCTINSPALCLRRKCVYEMRCLRCNDAYIGSTLRFLHTRIQEHMSRSSSSVFQHKERCGGAFRTTCLATSSDVTSLRFKEAILIRRHNPAINNKRESEEILSMTFE